MITYPIPRTNSKGQTIWHNAHGARHREDGPAFEDPDGTKVWYRHGFLHREDGPAVIWDNGVKYWFLNGAQYEPMEWLIKVHELKNKS